MGKYLKFLRYPKLDKNKLLVFPIINKNLEIVFTLKNGLNGIVNEMKKQKYIEYMILFFIL